jgi:hypothetical protein
MFHPAFPLLLLLSLWSNLGCAQFFPTEQAAWCLRRNTPDGTDQYTLALEPTRDTVIQGLTYMVIEYTSIGTPVMDLWPFSRCYVRNDDEGRGYARVDGMDVEMLIGDIDAPVGAIVQDIATGDTNCDSSWEYGSVTDMIVDSIVDLEENGIQARRVYVQPLCYPNFSPSTSFWQADMGTPFGPFLMLNGLSMPSPVCAAVDDTTRFRLFEELQLGGPLCSCYDLELGSGTIHRMTVVDLWPNPSLGLFHLPATQHEPLTVLDIHGREVLHLPPYSREIDLSLQPPGIYTVLQKTGRGRSVQRLVVVR